MPSKGWGHPRHSDTEVAIRTHAPSGASASAAVRVIANAVVLAFFVLGLIDPVLAAAEPATLEARVLWASQDRVYIASTDTTRLGPGARLTFVLRKKAVAAGEITRVLDGEMVIARLIEGTLPREKDLKRVRVVLQPPLAPRSLRVGYPAAARSTPFFACERMSLARPPGSYRVEAGGAVHRIIREPGSRPDVPWPD